GAEEQSHTHGHERGQQRLGGAVDDAGEGVPAGLVGAEPVVEAGRQQGGGVTAVGRVEVGEQAGQQRPGDGDEKDEGGAHGRRGDRTAGGAGAPADGVARAGEDVGEAHGCVPSVSLASATVPVRAVESSVQSRSTPTLAAVVVSALRAAASLLFSTLPEAAVRVVRRRTSMTGWRRSTARLMMT